MALLLGMVSSGCQKLTLANWLPALRIHPPPWGPATMNMEEQFSPVLEHVTAFLRLSLVSTLPFLITSTFHAHFLPITGISAYSTMLTPSATSSFIAVFLSVFTGIESSLFSVPEWCLQVLPVHISQDAFHYNYIFPHEMTKFLKAIKEPANKNSTQTNVSSRDNLLVPRLWKSKMRGWFLAWRNPRMKMMGGFPLSQLWLCPHASKYGHSNSEFVILIARILSEMDELFPQQPHESWSVVIPNRVNLSLWGPVGPTFISALSRTWGRVHNVVILIDWFGSCVHFHLINSFTKTTWMDHQMENRGSTTISQNTDERQDHSTDIHSRWQYHYPWEKKVLRKLPRAR